MEHVVTALSCVTEKRMSIIREENGGRVVSKRVSGAGKTVL